MAKRAPRLQFIDEELSAPEVCKAAQKAARRAEKLEAGKGRSKNPQESCKN